MEKIVDPSCPTGWIVKEVIGSGRDSTINKVCCGDNCNFAIKRNRPDKKVNLKTEAANQAKCANAGLCPKVYYSFDDEFIMDKLDFPVYKLFTQYKDPTVIELIVKNLFDLLDQLHQIGLIHGDLHLNNVMVKDGNPGLKEDMRMSDLERYLGHDYRYYFVDLSDDEPPPNISPVSYLVLNDWAQLFEGLLVPSLSYLKPIILEKINQLADPSLTDPDTGITNFMIMIINLAFLRYFFQYLITSISPEIINLQDHEGNTILHHVIAQNRGYKTSIYKMLIEAGADPKIKNHGGFIALDYEQKPEVRDFLATINLV